jgi:hypothetical protein
VVDLPHCSNRVGHQEIPHYSTILSFHHPRPMPIVQNEPNSAIADWGQPCGGTPAPRPARDEMCKTKPISPVGQGPGGRSVQNEPNVAGLSCKTKPIWPGDGDAGAPKSETCETNPIPGELDRRARPIVQNEPNFTGQPRLRRAKCAKRTQFRRCRSGTALRRDARPAASGRRGPKCAKRSQFRKDSQV